MNAQGTESAATSEIKVEGTADRPPLMLFLANRVSEAVAARISGSFKARADDPITIIDPGIIVCQLVGGRWQPVTQSSDRTRILDLEQRLEAVETAMDREPEEDNQACEEAPRSELGPGPGRALTMNGQEVGALFDRVEALEKTVERLDRDPWEDQNPS